MHVQRRARREPDTTAERNLERRQRIADWVANYVIPHEAEVRAWLSRARVPAEDADELTQEAYCRLAMLDTVDHIDRPGAYFFSIVRNLLVRRLRRARIVQIEAIAEIEAYCDEPGNSPEALAGGRLDHARLLAFIAALPERCGEVVRLRKIEGWSQREIADHLGMTEKAVEKQVWVGVKAIQRAWAEAHEEAGEKMRLFESGPGGQG